MSYSAVQKCWAAEGGSRGAAVAVTVVAAVAGQVTAAAYNDAEVRAAGGTGGAGSASTTRTPRGTALPTAGRRTLQRTMPHPALETRADRKKLGPVGDLRMLEVK